MSILFDQYPVKVLHLEATNVCNASCPQCGRETEDNFDNTPVHLSVEQIKLLFTVEFIQGLDKMFLCGNYGDPAAGAYTLDLFRYFRSINPTIVLGMNTNGSLRNREWWAEVAGILNQPKDYVVWSLDGLANTNHVYRVGTEWHKIISNAQSFIQHGGHAHWDMLVFEHNEHQVESAIELAQDMGFTWFRAKVSKRFKDTPIKFLNPPKSFNSPVVDSGKIECRAMQEQSLYVSASGIVHPCCWLGYSDGISVDQFSKVQESWITDPVEACSNTCRVNNNGSSFTNQWQKEINLKESAKDDNYYA